MLKVGILGPALLVMVAAAGLSGCASNSGKSESAQAPAPAPAQVETAATTQTAPASPTNQQGKQGRKGSKSDSAKSAKSPQPAPLAQSEKPGAAAQAAQPVPAVQPTPPAPATPPGKIGPGMNARGEVVDSTKVEAGYGQPVKGLRDWEGEITGKPAPGSKFTQLQIGMPMRQVTDLVGQPSDQGAYITGKAFIPFFFGSDTHRQELVYKNHGRLIFAGGSMGDFGSAHLVWIIHNSNEPPYR